MAIPLIDISDEVTISSLTYPARGIPNYQLSARNKNYLILSEISMSPDSIFKTEGRIQMFINGSSITSKSGALSEVKLKNGLTLPFRNLAFIFLEPNATLDIFCRMNSLGTGNGEIQFSVTGVEVDKTEFLLLKKKFFGVA